MTTPPDKTFAAKVLLYIRDPAVAWWRKAFGLLSVLYVVSPIDAIPDVILILGWLDDLGVLGATAWWFMRQINRHAAARTEIELNPPPSKSPGEDQGSRGGA